MEVEFILWANYFTSDLSCTWFLSLSGRTYGLDFDHFVLKWNMIYSCFGLKGGNSGIGYFKTSLALIKITGRSGGGGG